MRVRLLIASVVLLWSFAAFADKVPPPPPECPMGSTPDTGHEGPHCAPLDCTSDSDCKGGLVCREVSLCMEEKMMSPGRSPVESLYKFVEGTCEDPSTCKSPASCKGGKRCIKAAGTATPTTTKTPEPTKTPEVNKTPTSTPPEKAKGCAVSSPSSDSGLFWMLLSLGFLWLRRRSRCSIIQ